MIECYWPGITAGQVEDVVERARRSALELTGEGSPVSFLGSIFVPADEMVFLLFGAGSAAAVRRAGERAAISFERISRSITAGAGAGGPV